MAHQYAPPDTFRATRKDDFVSDIQSYSYVDLLQALSNQPSGNTYWPAPSAPSFIDEFPPPPPPPYEIVVPAYESPVPAPRFTQPLDLHPSATMSNQPLPIPPAKPLPQPRRGTYKPEGQEAHPPPPRPPKPVTSASNPRPKQDTYARELLAEASKQG